jgi:Leucine-rich repeat (LRR) protein
LILIVQAQNKIKNLNEISNKEQLEVLHLRENQIQHLNGFHAKNSTLAYLNLRNNQISDFDELTKLKGLSGLRHVVLLGLI